MRVSEPKPPALKAELEVMLGKNPSLLFSNRALIIPLSR